MGVREHLRCRMPSTGGHPMARIHYAIRAGAFAYSFLVLAIHGAERGFGAWYWLALVVQFLVYPHLAYLHARRAAEPRRAERINLYLDATLLGAWIGVLHFPLWIAYAALFSTSLNAIVVFGAVRGAWVIAAFAAGAAVGMALRGVEFLEETSPLVTMLCFVGSLAYSGAVGAVVYALRERVRDSEARYRLLAENAADLIAIVSREGTWIYASPSFAAVLDPAGLIAGSDAFAHAHPDDATNSRIALLRSAITGKEREMRLRLVDREGRMRQYRALVQPVKGEALPAERLVLALRDVTDLRESEERLLITAHALEGMTEATMITAADGTIVTVNRAFCEITGHERGDVLGQPEKAVRSGLQPAEYYDEVYATVHRLGHWSGTGWNRRKDGALYREWRSVRSVKDSSGAVTHYVHVFYEADSPRAAAGTAGNPLGA